MRETISQITTHCSFLGVQKVPIQPEYIVQTSRKWPLICKLKLLSWPRVSKVMSTLGRPILITILSLTSLSTNHWPALSEWCHGLRPTEASLQPFHQTLMDGNAESHNFCFTIYWIPGPTLKVGHHDEGHFLLILKLYPGQMGTFCTLRS